MNPIHQRDGRRCVVHGDQAQTVHHRVHGDRSDMRPSNLLSVCGDGVRGGHGWIEAHPAAAGLDSDRGWTVTALGAGIDLEWIPAWYENGPYGQGWYRLDDQGGFAMWPGSIIRTRINPVTFRIDGLPGRLSQQETEMVEPPPCLLCDTPIPLDWADVTYMNDPGRRFMLGHWECPARCDPRTGERGSALR